MTRKLLILAYIAAVLALSGMVRADDSGKAFVREAKITTSGILNVDGVFKSLCVTSPHIVATDINENVVTLVVQTKSKPGMCAAVIANKPFQVIFDLKELPLQAGNLYTIKFGNFEGDNNEFAYRAIPSQVDNTFKIGKRNLKGVLVYYQNLDSNGSHNGLVLQNGNDSIPVVAPEMVSELKSFKNGEVNITGYVVNIATTNNGVDISQGDQVSQVIFPVSIGQ